MPPRVNEKEKKCCKAIGEKTEDRNCWTPVTLGTEHSFLNRIAGPSWQHGKSEHRLAASLSHKAHLAGCPTPLLSSVVLSKSLPIEHRRKVPKAAHQRAEKGNQQMGQSAGPSCSVMIETLRFERLYRQSWEGACSIGFVL
jgi:hypothetical protein